jgi:hypothetical protein
MQQFMEPAAMLIKLMVEVIDRHTLAFQKTKTIIAADIISWIHAENSNRMVVRFHFPHNGCYMVYVVKMSNKKQIHIFYPCGPDFTKGICTGSGTGRFIWMDASI